MRIPEETIELVRQSSDIVEVVGEVVRLKKAGRNFLGLCPFHNEKTPSFNVSPERGVYKCFGCGKGGNAITFIKDTQHLSFVESVRFLAKRYGISIPEDDGESSTESSRYENGRKLLALVADFYKKQLHQKNGKAALKYFMSRGFTEETFERWGLGFAPDEWRAVLALAKENGFSEQTLEDSGLTVRKEDGTEYDRFRNRAMFPVHDAMGRVIAFGARRLDEDKTQPKYINSPQSLLYDKSNVLFGIFQARNSISSLGFALMTEGYSDTISLHQFGFTNTIASSGTSLTHNQLKLLKRYCERIFFVYDSDTAGQSATVRGVELALEEGFEVRIVRLPSGDDPDSFIQKSGGEQFRQRVASSVDFVEFYSEKLKSSGGFDSPAQSGNSIRQILELVACIKDPIGRDFQVRALAGRFSLSESTLYDSLRPLLQSKSKERSNQPVATVQKQARLNVSSENSESLEPTATSSQDSNSEVATSKELALRDTRISAELTHRKVEIPTDLTNAELDLYRNALDHREVLSLMMSEELFADRYLVSHSAKVLYTESYRAFMETPDVGKALLEHNEAWISSLTAQLLIQRESPSDSWLRFQVTIEPTDWKMVYADCLKKLRIDRLSLDLRLRQGQLRSLEPLLAGKMLEEIHIINVEKRRLHEALHRLDL